MVARLWLGQSYWCARSVTAINAFKEATNIILITFVVKYHLTSIINRPYWFFETEPIYKFTKNRWIAFSFEARCDELVLHWLVMCFFWVILQTRYHYLILAHRSIFSIRNRREKAFIIGIQGDCLRVYFICCWVVVSIGGANKKCKLFDYSRDQ